jgi:hypothetical protein
MEPLFLPQLLGLYFMLVGTIVMVRKASIMPGIAQLAANRPLIMTIAFVEIAAGLAILLVNPVLTFDWHGLIALVGWMLLAEGIIYLALPAREVQKFIKRFNTPAWYFWGGLIAVIAGIYLMAAGFQFV